MASPQIEDGFTKIANEIMDALCRYRIPGEERQVLDAILRKTYGWGKCEDAISLTQFVELTGLKKPNVIRAVKRLLSKKIILVIKSDNAPAQVYKFNKNYEQWKPLSKKITLSKVIKNVIKSDNLALSKVIPTKETITKEKKDNRQQKTLFSESVLLTEAEHHKLVAKFGRDPTFKAIEILNNYIMSTGKRYKSHYHTILGWPIREALGDGQTRRGGTSKGVARPDDAEIAEILARYQ